MLKERIRRLLNDWRLRVLSLCYHQRQDDYSCTVFWYIVLGVIHELVHWVVAFVTCCLWESIPLSTATSPQDTRFWFNLLIGRKLALSSITRSGGFSDDENENGDDEAALRITRHAGWIASLFLAVWIEMCYQRQHHEQQRRATTRGNFCSLRWAAWVTALEALWTDLLQWPTVPTILGDVGGPGMDNTGQHQQQERFLHCGNFGMILLHHVWWTNEYGSVALDVLEKMIQVTMMRGAQSGGVVCFHPLNDRLPMNTTNNCGGDRKSVV